MGRIKLLGGDTISQIAAGEVVERPASVVKELLENSVDSGATAISISIAKGGLDEIRITDNGCGIEEEDIKLSFERHATSKLRSADDLLHIATLGFRGEALHAISSVSKVTMTTRTAGKDSGLRVINDSGRITDIRAAGTPMGTTISVEKLFHNVPARLKFMKSARAESGYISDCVMQAMVAHPEISFKLTIDGKTIYHTPGTGELLAVLYGIYDHSIVAKLVPVEGKFEGYELSGFIGTGEAARGNRSAQTFVLNGRPVFSPAVVKAVEHACRERVMVGRFPLFALKLRMFMEDVDVNVHPNKLEVRFRDEQAVSLAIINIVSESLEKHFKKDIAKIPVNIQSEPTSEVKPAPRSASAYTSYRQTTLLRTENRSSAVRDVGITAAGMLESKNRRAGLIQPEKKENIDYSTNKIIEYDKYQVKGAVPVQEEPIEEKIPDVLRIIGSVFDTYILLQSGNELLLVDQHAAHERVLFDRYKENYDNVHSQPLLTPEVVNVTHSQHETIMENIDVFTKSGFEIEPFGASSFQVRSVPFVLGGPQVGIFFTELADRLSDIVGNGTMELKRDAIIKLACTNAVKGGDKLKPEEIEKLVSDILTSGINTCPHGRPIISSISIREIEKRFGRVK